MKFLKNIKKELSTEANKKKEHIKKETERKLGKQVPVKTVVTTSLVVASVTAAAVMLFDQKKIMDIKHELMAENVELASSMLVEIIKAYDQGLIDGAKQIIS